MSRLLPRFPHTAALAAAGVMATAAWLQAQTATVRVPADLGEGSLAARRDAQLASRPRFKIFHGFGFRDRLAESGITFRHRIVDDAGLTYKPVHYDHGNGVAAADVDGDRLPDLYFLTQLGRNELWKNLGGGRFRDITGEAGVGMEDRVSVAASFADFDNDGDADLFVTTVRQGNALFLNDGRGRFRDATAGSGLEYSGHSSGAVPFDYDNDGLVDLFLANVGVYTTEERGRGGYYVGVSDAFSGHLVSSRAERSTLYRNLGGGRFRDVSEEALLVDRSWSGDAAAADLDGDGFQDLYVLNMQGDDHFYQNVRGKFFVDKTASYFPKTPWGTMGVKVFDWNRDGLVDVLLTDMHSDMSEEIGPEREKLKARMQWGEELLAGGGNNLFGNALFEQRPGGRFEEVSDRVGAENYWPWGPSVGDLNADGWDDVFIAASMNFPFRYGVNSVLLNNRGETFLDSEFLLGVEPRAATEQPWFELDCGAAVDAAPMAGGKRSKHGEHGAAAAGGGRPECAGRSGRVTVLAAAGSRAAVLLDFDQDGDLDIVTNDFNAAPQILVSDLAERRAVRFLAVRLVGTRSNRDGLGATVTVHAGDGAQSKIHDGKSGYLSQSLLPLYFGLGEDQRVERVEVRWPSGRRQVVPQPPLGTLIEIVEPAQ